MQNHMGIFLTIILVTKSIQCKNSLYIKFHKTDWYIVDGDGSKCLMLIFNEEQEKGVYKNVKKILIKSHILLKEKIITQKIMIINTLKL